MGKQVTDFITYLRKASGLGIQCPCCERIIPTSKADLFLGDSLSKKAVHFRDAALERIRESQEELRKLKTEKLERVAKTTKSVNIGKILEKFAPILRGFGCSPDDCRGLFEPIDYVVFHGLNKGNIDHIEFMDIKSGKARLNDSQREIRRVVEDGKVQFRIVGSKQ